jgi:hypothetical protein
LTVLNPKLKLGVNEKLSFDTLSAVGGIFHFLCKAYPLDHFLMPDSPWYSPHRNRRSLDVRDGRSLDVSALERILANLEKNAWA